VRENVTSRDRKREWVVHFHDEINRRDIASHNCDTEDEALRYACQLQRDSYTIHRIIGPNKTIKSAPISLAHHTIPKFGVELAIEPSIFRPRY
jgi:hypothetical protein